MIKQIIRLCIKDYEHTADKKVRERYSILGGVLGIICNLLLFAGKCTIGFMSNSIAILSDAFNNLTDMGSSVISIISAKLSNRPPDRDHPFGHGRVEYLASLTIGIIILVVGYTLCDSSLSKFFTPEPLEISSWTIVVLVLSIAVKGWMYSYNRYIGKKIDSGVNEATAADSINDAVATAGVLLAAIVQQFTDLPVDAAAGMIIGLMIMYAGGSIVRKVINILLGKAPDPALVRQIADMSLQCDYVVGIHDIKIHDYGPGRLFGSLHAEIPDTADLVEVHAALDVLEDEIEEKFHIDFSIHMDPLCTNPTTLAHTRRILDSLIQKEYPLYHTDNLRITAGKVRLNIICDLHIPPQEYSKEHCRAIRRTLSAALKQYDARYHIVLARIIPEPTLASDC